MLSRIHTKRIIMLACALAAALLFPSGEACTQTIDFTAEVLRPGRELPPLWPFAIVSFTSAALLPISEVCIADCKTMTIQSESGAGEPFQLVIIGGEPVAVVSSHKSKELFTVCVGGRASCMRYTVLRAR